MKKLYTPYLSQQPSQLVRKSLGLIQAHTYNTTSKCMKAFTTVPVAMKNTLLPGWGLDVDHMKATTEHPRQFFGQPALYPTALGAGTSSNEDCGLRMLTLRELTMLHIMNALTDKSGWDIKIFDNEIVKRWKAECLSRKDVDVTEKMIDYVIAELQWKASNFASSGHVVVYNGDVVKSDTAVGSDVMQSLLIAVTRLEDALSTCKDYHPGSSDQVWDLVHPSLWPLVYGRSRILEQSETDLQNCVSKIGIGKTIPGPRETEAPGYRKISKAFSNHFQWLPAEVSLRDGVANLTTYINNLHPQQHQDLYDVINQILTRTIPLWNITLRGLENRLQQPRIKVETIAFDPDPEDVPDEDRPAQNQDEDEDDYFDRLLEWEDGIRKTILPEPGVFHPPKEGPHAKPSLDIWDKYKETGIQVIVKLVNIELKPDNPEYTGGTWHVEGQLNEHICATALYYFDNANITDSHLAFRQQCDDDDVKTVHYPQGVHTWLKDIYGCEQDGPTVQEVGSVFCKEGRLLTFPNILQHRVLPFKLADSTKPGHRKILALFLVDPNIKIISTANIPPQRGDWFEQSSSQITPSHGVDQNNQGRDVQKEQVDFPISYEEAKSLRLKLMDERKEFLVQQQSSFESYTFSLCEH